MQTRVGISERSRAAEAPRAVQAPGAAPAARAGGVAFKHRSLALGMSDDEVLNMPGWGVPSRIEKSREGRVYRESWMYDRGGGVVRWLYFANARLTGLETEYAQSDRFAGYALR
jgi:hypothetical protein